MSRYLGAGKTYILAELSAPDGYDVAEPVTFTVMADGSEQTITMIDSKGGIEVDFWKHDPDGMPLGGAELSVWKLTDAGEADGSFEEYHWTSSADEAHTVLLEPGTYVMHETSAPLSYEAADDIRFTVTDKGTLDINGSAVDSVIMTDAYAELELSVLKRVGGNMGDRTKGFHFKAAFTPSKTAGLPEEIFYVLTSDGIEKESGTIALFDNVCTFELAHDERITFILPYGTGYSIEELDGESDGYTVTAEDTAGVLIDSNAAVRFTNIKKGGIPTGFTAMTTLSALIMTITGFILFIAAVLRLRRKKE